MAKMKKCPHCKGRKTFKTKAQHPKGAGHDVPCSRCKGRGEVRIRVQSDG